MNKVSTIKRYRRLTQTGFLGFAKDTSDKKDDAIKILRAFPYQSDEFDERILRIGGFYEEEDT